MNDRKLYEQFKAAHPETVGEKDQSFDTQNYCEWLEQALAAKDLEAKKWRELAEQQNVVIELCATALTSVVPCSERSESDYRLKIARAAFEVGRATTAYNAAKEESNG